MKKTLLLLFFFIQIFICGSFHHSPFISISISKTQTHKYSFRSKTTPLIKFVKPSPVISILQLIRPANILPTFMLSFLGGWITNPSIQLFSDRGFWIASLITQLVMSGSMVINDIYDIDIDRQNHPTRPLPSGIVSTRTAFGLTAALFGSAMILSNLCFTREPIIPITTYASVLMLILYTPIFKRMCFIKNVICASIVSGSIAFSALAIDPLSINNHLLVSIIRLVWFSSLHMEILNDIRDYDGDKRAGITTIPVVFGKMTAGFISKILLYFGVSSAIVSTLHSVYPLYIPAGIALACSPMIRNIDLCTKDGFSKESIRVATSETIKSLFMNMLIYCFTATRSSNKYIQ